MGLIVLNNVLKFALSLFSHIESFYLLLILIHSVFGFQQQQEAVDNIEDNIESAQEDVHHGTKHLAQVTNCFCMCKGPFKCMTLKN